MKKILFLSLVVICAGTLSALPPPPPPRGAHPGPGMKNQRIPRNIWRAFAELSDAERKEMLNIQRNDPDKFRELMSARALDIEKAERAERQHLTTLVEQFKAAKNDAEKDNIRNQMRDIHRKRFNKRLESNRRHLEAMKRRAEFLEKELDKRAENAEKIVDLLTESMLTGKNPFGEHHERRRGNSRPPMPPTK